MNFSGRYRIPASPEAVWVGLHDAGVLAACIPGCESVERVSETEFKAAAVIKVGPVKTRFEGRVSLRPRLPAPGYSHALTVTGEGQGESAGSARGESEIRLAPESDGTILEYDTKAAVGGKLALLGQRAIDGAAKTLSDAFIANFTGIMQYTDSQPTHTTASAPPGPNAADLGPQIWVVGMIAIVILLLILFGIVL